MKLTARTPVSHRIEVVSQVGMRRRVLLIQLSHAARDLICFEDIDEITSHFYMETCQREKEREEK